MIAHAWLCIHSGTATVFRTRMNIQDPCITNSSRTPHRIFKQFLFSGDQIVFVYNRL